MPLCLDAQPRQDQELPMPDIVDELIASSKPFIALLCLAFLYYGGWRTKILDILRTLSVS